MNCATLNGSLAREAEIEDAKDELNDSLAHVQSANQDITSNLPNEMLGGIFEAGLALTKNPYDLSWNSWTRKRSKPFEILVSSVSRRWRDVALQTPQLWTDLLINVSKSTAGDMLDLYLSRSKSCFLDIAFIQKDRINNLGFDTKNFADCLEQLIPYATHWRQFVLEDVMLKGKEPHFFKSLVGLHAPALERMVINLRNGNASVLNVLSAAPLLSSMELRGVYVVPPSNTVTSLKLQSGRGSLSYTEFSRLISPMQSLTHLSMDANLAGISNRANAAGPRIKLHSVLSLDLDVSYNPSIGVLHFLDLPALESLVIRGATVDIVEGFISHRQSYLSLRSLTLSSYGDDQVGTIQVRKFTRLFPNVRDFAMDDKDTAFLFAFCKAQTDELIWPQLSVITLKLERSAFRLKEIIRLAENRATLGHPISRIMLSPHSFRWYREDMERLKELVEVELLDDFDTK